MNQINCGKNCIISEKANIGNNVVIGHNCIIEGNVKIGDNVIIDHNVIINSDVTIENDTTIGANCIIGEKTAQYYSNKELYNEPTHIGKNCLIRSGSIIYGGSTFGDGFQTGHQVTIREKTKIGTNVSVGTLSDIQGNCEIGNYVRLHSNVHIGQLSKIDDFVWIFPYVILTNDPTPPSEHFVGVEVEAFSIIATAAVVMPGIRIEHDSLVGAGAIVTKDVQEYTVVAGNPAKYIADIRNVKHKITGEVAYPWREHFNRAMPWSNSDFETWYNSLDFETKKFHKISFLE